MKKFLYNFVMSSMAVLSICLSILIYTKDDKRASNFNEKIGIEVDFGQINENISSFIDKTVGLDFLDFVLKENEEMVASVDSYLPKDNDFYTTNDSKVISLCSGTITFLSSDKSGYMLVVQYDNGINATYSYLTEIFVDKMDRVDEDDVIGNSNEFKVIFERNGKQIRYEEFFA